MFNVQPLNFLKNIGFVIICNQIVLKFQELSLKNIFFLI